MNRYVFYGWKGVLIAVVVFMVLVSVAQAFGEEPGSQELTLSATVVRGPSGSVGTITFTFTLDEANPAVMNNYSSIGPGPSTVPEPSTLALLGLGIVALVGWRRVRKQC